MSQSPLFRVPSGRAGFTLPEAMIALSVLGMALAAALNLMGVTGRTSAEVSRHIRYIDDARGAEQKIVAAIQEGAAVGLYGGRLQILRPGNVVAEIRYVDEDGDPATTEDNYLEYVPDLNQPGQRTRLVRNVSALEEVPMFRILPHSPRAAVVSFYVGDVGGEEGGVGGLRTHGVEVRAVATPRNLGAVYY